MSDEREIYVEIEEPAETAYSDASTYAQTLSNTVLALVQWSVVDAEERLFVRMQLKRLIDAQIALKDLYIDE